MAIAATGLLTIGFVLLAHAAYSAHEHSLLTATPSKTTPSSAGTTATSLPLDIIIETLVSLLLIIPGVVLNSRPLQPVKWREWAGNVEREAAERHSRPVGSKEDKIQTLRNPFSYLEERAGFLDVRQKKKEFTSWMLKQGDKQE